MTKSFLVSLENGYNKNKSSTSQAIRGMFPFLKQIDSNLPCVYLVTQKHHFSSPTLNIISVLYIGSQSLAPQPAKQALFFFAFFRRGWAGVERQTRTKGEGAEREYRASRPAHFVLAFASLKNAKR